MLELSCTISIYLYFVGLKNSDDAGQYVYVFMQTNIRPGGLSEA